MFAVVAHFTIHAAQAGDFLSLVVENAQSSLRDEPGCRQFDVVSDPARPGDVLLYELYDDAAAFDAHLTAVHFKRFDAATAAMIADKTVRTYADVRQ